MNLVYTIQALQALLEDRRALGNVGLVPTMGALHQGHASLVRRALQENGTVVVSVFVNPTQFNNPNDLATYPRNLEADCALLEALSPEVIIFAPAVNEIYPTPDTRKFSYPPIDTVMEGGKRPGHFNGVCQVVSKLFAIVTPDNAYFGEKDYQQIAVIRAMVADLSLPVHLVACPIIREASGLALASRNERLTAQERSIAAQIHAVMTQSTTLASTQTPEEVQQYVIDTLQGTGFFEVEYYQIVHPTSLQPIKTWDEAPYAVGCITVYCGENHVRLIDNITYGVASS